MDALARRHGIDEGMHPATVDLDLQSRAETILRSGLAALNRHDVSNAAMVVLENESGAVRALATAPGDDVSKALERVVLRDPNPDVAGRALTSLAKNNPTRAVLLARSLVRSDGPEQDRRAAAALDVVGDHGLPSDLGMLLDDSRPRRLARLRSRTVQPRRLLFQHPT